MSKLIQLVYASSATYKMDSEELLQLLTSARARNKANGITGILLYRDGNFLQVVEGEASAVSELFTRIERDPRHHGLIMISKQSISERHFEEWEMGFTDLTDVDLTTVPGYSDYLNNPFTPLSFATNPTRATVFLETFKHYTR